MKTSQSPKTSIDTFIRFLYGLVVLLLGLAAYLIFGRSHTMTSTETRADSSAIFIQPDSNFSHVWTAPSDWRMMYLSPKQKELVLYGRELIAHTSDYLGPKGSVRAMSNGMNCQNCHLKAGAQPWGNNYFAVESTYPKFRARSGTVENQVKRVNDCFERSLNGKKLDSTSKEMQAILAYIAWLGKDVAKGDKPKGSGIFKLKFLKRATDLDKGKMVYEGKCQSCHQANGEGVLAEGGKSYTYPPLWGVHSYNQGAGLFRISNLAGYVKYNMPLGTTYEKAQLSDEEAWDVAAYINSMPRPSMDLSHDWPKIAKKPFDHPFGPYADSYSEKRHKYGPYKK
ncbi:c-type cytochrome [Cytophagaceae bacterium 50C-KIRBA]|uniref:C-type cytochrome n=1 Tax=Aquirufa beregesia TaxID=2516556 RepID=A0ABX0EXK2_9BACT|nr:c-type cytochrome [Aquirufa beregesia]NGZ45326.1 c-type cytochrome [Aquirufa beregesia]